MPQEFNARDRLQFWYAPAARMLVARNLQDAIALLQARNDHFLLDEEIRRLQRQLMNNIAAYRAKAVEHVRETDIPSMVQNHHDEVATERADEPSPTDFHVLAAPRPTRADNEVGPSFENRADEPRNVVRLMRAVTVEEEDNVSFGVRDPDLHRVSLAFAVVEIEPDTETRRDFTGIVSRVRVNDDDVVTVRLQRFQHASNSLAFVLRGNDNGEVGDTHKTFDPKRGRVTCQIRPRITPRTATRSTPPRHVVITREDLRDARGHLPCRPEIEELVRPVRVRAEARDPRDEELRPRKRPPSILMNGMEPPPPRYIAGLPRSSWSLRARGHFIKPSDIPIQLTRA